MLEDGGGENNLCALTV